jgi:TRAP-type C4-dicarboxylate transport system permease small subunit
MLPMLALAASVKVPGLPKPLGQISLAQLTGRVIRAAMGISGAVALIMFIWGGVQWMSSQGNAEKTKKAQNTLLWSVIGLIAIFGAYTLLNFVLGVL